MSSLLGMEAGRGVADIQIGNPSLHDTPLRELTLPEDVLVLSLSRGKNTLITHGDTRLMLNDWVTVLGTDDGLEEVAVRFGGEAWNRPPLETEPSSSDQVHIARGHNRGEGPYQGRHGRWRLPALNLIGDQDNGDGQG